MTRLASLSSRITSGSKKTPIFIKVFSGTDFSSYHSTWTFSTGTISLRSTTLPYHAYGNSEEPTTATNQICNRAWSLRAGTNTGTGVAINLTGISSGTLLTTETSLVSLNMPITFKIDSNNTTTGIVSNTQYYIKSINTNSITVSTTVFGAPVTSTATVNVLFTGSVSYATSATGNIGYWVNGVNMINPSAADEAPNGYLKFNNLHYNSAYNEVLKYSYSLNQDTAGGRVTSDGAYNYQSFSFENAWTTSTGEASLISYYNNSLTHANGHSKILGWSLDGFPVYGPYGYNQAMDHNSGVRVMTSGYTKFLSSTLVDGRVIDGVYDTFTYPLGMFIEDYYYAGNADLDIFNGRYCVTPEYPLGTYAYFCSADPETLEPTYPYVIGNYHKSTPLQGTQTTSTSTNGGGSAPKQTS